MFTLTGCALQVGNKTIISNIYGVNYNSSKCHIGTQEKRQTSDDNVGL